MTAWLQIALITEGVTDDEFLAGVLHRSVIELCALYVPQGVDVARPIFLRSRLGPSPVQSALDIAEREQGSFNLLVVHHDADGRDRTKVEDQWLAAYREDWAARERDEPLVFVVPIRETEAWAVADGDALRAVMGVTWDDKRLGVPADPERERDPKALLDMMIQQVARGRRASYLSRLAEHIDLSRLRNLKAFQAWEEEFVTVISTIPGVGSS